MDLGLGVDEIYPKLTYQYFLEAGLFVETADGDDAAWGDGHELTPYGQRVATEFAQARRDRRLRLPAARHALLVWLYDGDHDWPSDLIADPERSWFYGTKLTEAEIDQAAQDLFEDDLITGTRGLGSGTIESPRLTSRGRKRVEVLGNDQQPEERSVNIGQQYNINGAMTGNNNVGGTVTHQTSHITVNQQHAVDLAALLRVLLETGELSGSTEETEGYQIIDAVNSGEGDPVEHVGKVRQLVGRVLTNTKDLALKPAAQAAFTAIGNFAAIKMGVAPS